MEFISNFSLIDKEKWQSFVKNHPRGNFFQTPNMFNVLLETRNFSPFLLIGIQGDKIVGVLLANIQKNIKGKFGFFTSRAIIIGGPLVKENNPQLTNQLLSEFKKRVHRKVIYSQFRNLFELSPLEKEQFKKIGYSYQDHLDIHIALNKSPEKILADIHKSKKRNYTKSKNKGVIIKEISDENQIVDCYRLLQETYNRVKLPIPDISHFKSLSNLSASSRKYFGVYYNNKLIAFRLVLLYKNMIYDYYAGHDSVFNNKYPNDTLIINVLKWGSLNGFHFFDFGGAGKPNEKYGVRDYKMKFGGTLVNYGRFEKKHWPLLYFIIKQLFLLWKKLR